MAMNQYLPIKVLSIILIAGAIVLESWMAWLRMQGEPLLMVWPPILWLERFALIAHGLEGLAAAYIAPQKGKSPLNQALYTFWVGTVGLVELIKSQENHENLG